MAKKIDSLKDLQALQKKAQADIDLRGGPKEMVITVHMGTCGIAAGARDVLMSLMDNLRGDAGQTVTIQQTGCAGLCDREPMISVRDKAGNVYRYGRLDRNKVRQIVQEHVGRGNPVTEYLLVP